MSWHGRLVIGNSRNAVRVGRIRNAGAVVSLGDQRHRYHSSFASSHLLLASRLTDGCGARTHRHSSLQSLPKTTRRRFASDTATPVAPSLSAKDFRYCVDLVQNRDRESYLCGLLMPSDARKAYFAIRAWNVELASIKDGSTQKQPPTGGDGSGPNVALQVRIQWWWDALGRIYEDPRQQQQQQQKQQQAPRSADYAPFSVSDTLADSYLKNPIVRVLHHAVHDKKLTRRFLERLSEAREKDLHHKQPETTTEMIEYADSIFSSLLYLTLETVDVRDESVDMVAQHAGIGIGLVTALRGIRFRLIREECSIPMDVLPAGFPYDKLIYTNHCSLVDDDDDDDDKNEVTNPHNQLNEEERRQLRDAVEEICGLAFSHLAQARELQSNVPKRARTCFLPVIPAMHYLSKLEKADYDIFDDALLEHDNMTILALLGRTWLTGVF